jgi:hypothetical protein
MQANIIHSLANEGGSITVRYGREKFHSGLLSNASCPEQILHELFLWVLVLPFEPNAYAEMHASIRQV